MTDSVQKVFIIAGEVSGDVLGSAIIKSLISKCPNIEIIGIGGENMVSAGMKPVFNMQDIAVMGVIEVLKNLKTINIKISEAVNSIIQFNPDVVITIDSGGFNKRVIKKVKQLGFTGKCYHVVAPAVWAWGSARAKSFAKIFDKLYCFFDFEIPYFTKYGLNTIAVGHPVIEKGIQNANAENFVKQYNIANDTKVIMLIPGSRKNEVLSVIDEYKILIEKISKDYKNVVFVMPVVETIKGIVNQKIQSWNIKPILINGLANRYDAMARADLAIAVSGTVSVELALLKVPSIIVYKFNYISYLLARLLIKIKWVSLVNILMNKTVYPELFQDKVSTKNIMQYVSLLLNDSKYRKSMQNDLENAKILFCKYDNPTKLIVNDILKTVK